MVHLNKIYKLMRSSTMLGILMVPLATGLVSAQSKAVGDIAPMSAWTVKPMAANTDNAYCALSRQYDQDLVLTIGQSVSEEYSLAIDFLDASLNVNKAYDVTLQPGPGQIRAYEMMPASARAMVIRIGFDDSFMSTLQDSGELKAEIEGKNYNFKITDFSQAQLDLNNCMQGLGVKTDIKTAQNDFSAQKIENASPIERPIKQIEQDTVEKKETIVDVPNPQKAISIAPPQKVASSQVTTPRAPSVKSRVSKVVEEVAPISVEPPSPEPLKPIVMSKVSSQIIEQAGAQPTPITISGLTKVDEQRARAEALMLEQKQAVEKAAAQKQEIERQKEQELAAQKAAELERQAEDMARQQSQQKTKQDAEAQKRIAEEKRAMEAEQLEFKRLAEENKKQKEISIQKANDLAKFKAENERLEKALEQQQERLATVDNTNPDAQSEIEEIRTRMKELEEENRSLYLEARQARGEIDKAVVETSNQALAKMREYEKKLEAAREDNLALSKEMEEVRRLKEDGRLDVVAGDWDLEKSTQRFNEAEREIKRLGLLLEQQRVAHRREKTELEQMLFDPAVTDKEQRRRLTELELKLEAAERQLIASGQRINSVRPNSSMPAMPAPSVASSTLGERAGLSPLPPVAHTYSDSSVMADIRAEQADINRLNAEIRNQQQVRASEPSVFSSIPRIEETPTRISAMPTPVQPPMLTQTNRPMPQMVSKREPTRPASSVMSGDDLRDMLVRAGVGLDGGVKQHGPGQYQWIAGQLKGQAQIVSLNQVGSLDKFITSFMALSKKACQGDFASLPAPDVAKGKAFEVACITPQSNLSSSLIFTQRGSEIIVIGHEISADDMDIAMDVRDRIAEKL